MSLLFNPSFILLADITGPSSGGGHNYNEDTPEEVFDENVSVSGNGDSSFEGGGN